MRVRVIFCWAGNVYDWYGDWPFPCVPSPGDTLAIATFVEDGVLEAEQKNVVFEGSSTGRYAGLEVSLDGLLSNPYNTKVVSVNWTGTSVELEVTSDIYQERDSLGFHLWEERKA